MKFRHFFEKLYKKHFNFNKIKNKKKFKESLKFEICTQILPRLEFSYLDEWIQHHLDIGFDKISIFNNGFRSITDSKNKIEQSKLPVADNLKKSVWSKKPHADYFLEYSDEEISEKIKKIKIKFKNKIEVINWEYGKNHYLKYPSSQKASIKQAQTNNELNNNFLLSIDPDEFVFIPNNQKIDEVILPYFYQGFSVFYFSQRIFQKRERNKAVLDNFKWGYDIKVFKSLCYGAISCFDIHTPTPINGKIKTLKPNIARINHYRGSPKHLNDPKHKTFKNIKFNKFDDSAKKKIL